MCKNINNNASQKDKGYFKKFWDSIAGFCDTLVKIRKPYLEYLRNLTPAGFFLSLGFYTVSRLDLRVIDLGNTMPTLFSFLILLIGVTALILNGISFFKDTVTAMNEVDKPGLSFKEALEILCKHNFGTQIFIFYLVVMISSSVVVIYAIYQAISYYKFFSQS